MRNPDRLIKMYERMGQLHLKFPDIRIMQMMINFSNWYNFKYHKDLFYIEDDEFLEQFEKFIKEMEW